MPSAPDVRTLAVLLAMAIAIYGLNRTTEAGVMLVILGAVVPAIASLGHVGPASLAIVSSPAALAGIVYVLSSVVSRSSPPPADDAQRRYGKAR